MTEFPVIQRPQGNVGFVRTAASRSIYRREGEEAECPRDGFRMIRSGEGRETELGR